MAEEWELKAKIKDLQAISARLQLRFQGELNAHSVSDYIDRNFDALCDLAYYGTDLKRKDVLLQTFKEHVLNDLEKHPSIAAVHLDDGTYYVAMRNILMRERLHYEVNGLFNWARAGIQNVPVDYGPGVHHAVHKHQNPKTKKPELLLSQEALLIYSDTARHGVLQQESIKLVLGYLEEEFKKPFDRTRNTIDADYVATILKGSASDQIEALQTNRLLQKIASEGDFKVGDEAAQLKRLEETLYKNAHARPGESEALDAAIRQKLEEKETELTLLKLYTYPTTSQRLEEVKALDVRLDFQNRQLEQWSRDRLGLSSKYKRQKNEIEEIRAKEALTSRHWRSREAKVEEKKPVILCDVGGTLITKNPATFKNEVNQPLVDVLNGAVKRGYNVQICSAGYREESNTFNGKKELEEAHLHPSILASARHKSSITDKSFIKVTAAIDDVYEDYIETVKPQNPDMRYFRPDELAELSRYLEQQKPVQNRIV